MAKKNKIYLIAGLTSIILYIVGIFTGAAIYQYTQSKTNQEFDILRSEIYGYEDDLNSIELEMLYLASSQGELGCKLILTSLNRVQSDLGYFWDNLPQKLEVYERDNSPDENYELLKKEYMTISLKAWLLSLSLKEKCGLDSTPLLYFYSRNCDDCVEQGEIIDSVRVERDLKVYTIDLNLDSDIVSTIKEAYGIQTAPSLLIDENVYKGLVDKEDLIRIIGEA